MLCLAGLAESHRFAWCRELKPLAALAFERGYISADWLAFDDFEKDLQKAIEYPGEPLGRGDDFSLFGDTVEELSSWAASVRKSAAKQIGRQPAWTISWRRICRQPIRSGMWAEMTLVRAAAARNTRNAA
jgi:hypothetical protein